MIKILIIGRTGSGKSTLERYLNWVYGLKSLKSYSTRPIRDTFDDSHIFIKSEDVQKYKKEFIAYTKIGDDEYFATESQLQDSDIYVIDPIGAKELLINSPNNDYFIIHLKVDKEIRRERTSMRLGYNFDERELAEDERFLEFEKDPESYLKSQGNIKIVDINNNKEIDEKYLIREYIKFEKESDILSSSALKDLHNLVKNDSDYNKDEFNNVKEKLCNNTSNLIDPSTIAYCYLYLEKIKLKYGITNKNIRELLETEIQKEVYKDK